jgi:hypothetical protein
VLATVGGWLLGIAIGILLGAIAEASGMGSQSSVGIGLGLGVGFAQWRVARPWFGAAANWMWISTLGMWTPFLLFDLTGALSLSTSSVHNLVLLVVAGGVGGAAMGWWQQEPLRSHSSRARWWVSISSSGWMVAAAVTFLVMVPGHPQSPQEMLRNFAALPLGGAVLGLVTGVGLLWLLDAPLTHGAAGT